MSALAGLFGAGLGAGLLLLTAGLRGTDPAEHDSRQLGSSGWDQRSALRLLGAVAVAVLTAAVTRWPIGALLAAVAAWTLPQVLGADRAHGRRVAKFEAIAGWAEMLRDTLAAAAGLEQAITVTAPLAPPAIRTELVVAAGRLGKGEQLPVVLRKLGEDLDDPTADLVISALVLAAEQRARNLGELLGSLAQAARGHAALRMRIEASRAQTRTASRITVGTTLAFAAGLILLDRQYLTAYDGTTGQIALLVVGLLFAGGFCWLTRLAVIPEPARLLYGRHAHTPPNSDGRL